MNVSFEKKDELNAIISVEIKNEIVIQDPTEKNIRKIISCAHRKPS